MFFALCRFFAAVGIFLVRIFYASMIIACEDVYKRTAYNVQIGKSKIGFIELTGFVFCRNKLADKFFKTGNRRVFERAACSLDSVGKHNDGRFF